MTTNTTTTGTSNSTTTANTTKGTSNSTNATSVAISTSDETTGTALDEQPTETPTLSVEELISLLDDDSIQNVTSSFIPPEKEQPKEWAGEVILFFLLGALGLFAATGIKRCRKKRTYSEIPTTTTTTKNLVV
ncbi:unnamed protein product [Cylindrotheca closterium]|uniref:Uncharacterized protein n=1 Tax=Cylindrotheca closterium TaxID=2856 RepID=A0AAD2FMV9_9STRA|nr:unnamed protein product [Cylindrotheca closterium]CAJ1970034.1 unnamed protein product [Cylindrotheca closterium]